MILPRALYSSSPLARDSHQNNPTLLVSWWCTGFALAIILVRLSGRYIRNEKLFREDKIIALSIIPLCARMGLVHVVLIWGTNNAIVTGLSEEDIRHREIGSRLVLASRIMYALFLWIAKFTVSEFLKRLTSVVWKRTYEIGLQGIRLFLILTFIAVLIATIGECKPFNHYWQVTPDPGSRCRQGMAQLITMGTADIITDLLLICFPIPIVLKSNMHPKRKLSLVLLFALSLILVGITLYRVIAVVDRHADQQFRSLLASLEILAAAAVSNAIVLGSFIRDRGTKKQRFRFGSTAGNSSTERTTNTPKRTITARDWGSDADLVGGLGMRCAPELTDDQPSLPRPAPIALPKAEHANALTPAPIGGRDWTHRPHNSISSDDAIDLEKSIGSATTLRPSDNEPPTTPRGMSFFDVGGLLGSERLNPATRRPQTQSLPNSEKTLPETPPEKNQNLESSSHLGSSQVASKQPASYPFTNPSSRGPRYSDGSSALLQDIGGLLSNDGHHGYHQRSGERDELVDGEDSTINEKNEGISSRDMLPPSTPEVRQDMSLVDVLRETPPQSMRGPSSRQAALQRMRRRDQRDNDSNETDGLGFQDVGGLLK